MKSFLIALVFLVIGGVVGGIAALGIGTGAGVATGLAAGACSTLEAAKDQGLVTEAQFDQVLKAAVAKVAGKVELPADAEHVDTAAGCAKMMAKLSEAGSSGQ